MLRGEVLRDFEHAITGAQMYRVDFGGVIGTHAMPKNCCKTVAEEDFLAALGSTFMLDLPSYLAGMGVHNDDEAFDSNWEPEFVDWRGNSDSGKSDWALSDSTSEPEVVDDSVLSESDIDFDSLEFEYRYAPQHWEELSTTLARPQLPFIGLTPGPVKRLSRCPVGISKFFDPFWSVETLQRICDQTNQYARQPSYQCPNKTNGGVNWTNVSLREIHCWLGICIRMGLKKLPSNRMYWSHRNFFGCPLIKASMRRAHFEKITRNIHLVDNSTTLVTDKTHVEYDKIAKGPLALRCLCGNVKTLV